MTEKEINFEENKNELLKMKQVSALIQEVRPYFLSQMQKKRAEKKKIKIVCAAFALLLFSFGTGILNQRYDIVNTIVYNNLTASELGFPTDEYGLISVDFDEF